MAGVIASQLNQDVRAEKFALSLRQISATKAQIIKAVRTSALERSGGTCANLRISPGRLGFLRPLTSIGFNAFPAELAASFQE